MLKGKDTDGSEDGKSSMKALQYVPRRMLASLVPPDPRAPKIPDDFLGPVLTLFTLLALLYYGASQRTTPPNVSPIEAIVIFATLIPMGTYGLLLASDTSLSHVQVISLLGYSMTSHVLTIFFSILVRIGHGNYVFFTLFTVLGGLSCLRLVIIFAVYTKRRGLNLLASCFSCIAIMLFLLFEYFSFIVPRAK